MGHQQRLGGWAGIAAAALLVGACGGGSSSQGLAGPAQVPPASSPPVVAPDPPRAVIYVGPCRSCVSAGAATSTLDGLPAGDLGPDAFAVVSGTQPSANVGPTWTHADARSALVGTVTSIDLERGEFRVGAELVRGLGGWLNGPESWIGHPARPSPVALTELRQGERVRVLGYRAADGAVFAVGLRRAGSADADRVVGAASAVDAAARRLLVGATTVDYAAAAVEGFAGGAVPPGASVEAVGRTTGGVLAATTLRPARSLSPEPGTVVIVYGVLTRLATGSAGVAELDVAGQRLRVAAACVGAVRPGDTVYATGIVRADGVLAEAPAAGRCSVSHSASSGGYGASLNGTLQAIDADGLVVGGVRVRWLPETAFYAAYTGARREPSELVVGERVSVHVTAAPIAGRGFASQVSPFVADDTSADATLRVDAAVPQVAADAVGLLGRPVRIDRATAAGLRDCNEGDPVVPLEPAEFMRFVFSGGYPRLVRMSVATDAAGEWRATSIVANDKPYCD